MATVTLLGSAVSTTDATNATVTATPALGSLIVVIGFLTGAGAGTFPTSAAVTDNNSSGAYTKINAALKATSLDEVGVWVRTTTVASAVSTVFTYNPSDGGAVSDGEGIIVLQVTGMNKVGAAAVRQSAIQSNQAAAGTPAPVFGSAPLTSNPIIGALLNATNPATMTPRTSFTEHVDTGYITPTTGIEVMSRDSGETATTQTWGGTSASAFGSLVVELDATGGARTQVVMF